MDCPAAPWSEPGELAELKVDSPGWLDFVRSRPDATAFHHPRWTATLAACYGFAPSVLALVEGGRVVAGVPLLQVPRPFSRPRAISLPFTDHLPALAAGGPWRRRLSEALVGWSGERGLGVEVRGDLGAGAGVARRITGVRHLLPLGAAADDILPRLDRNVRQRLSKLRRGRLQARVGASGAELEDFYALHLRTRRRLGVPVQPRRFFELLWSNLLRWGLGYCVVATLDGRPVAAAVFLQWNGTCIYKYSASEPEHWREAPNHLLLWTAIERACAAGARRLDLGRTELDNGGLRTFKSEWGAAEVPLIESGIGTAPGARPGGVAQRLLKGVIRSTPAPVCRASGELLYRYFP